MAGCLRSAILPVPSMACFVVRDLLRLLNATNDGRFAHLRGYVYYTQMGTPKTSQYAFEQVKLSGNDRGGL